MTMMNKLYSYYSLVKMDSNYQMTNINLKGGYLFGGERYDEERPGYFFRYYRDEQLVRIEIEIEIERERA